jgi:hypothetical protein
MIVFQHDHTRQVMAMSINTANQHPVLFNEPKTRGSLTGTRDDSFESIIPCNISKSLGSKIKYPSEGNK